ncbi:hypothetical protein BTJ39_09790 [Izhakiella australiensis]|uniref:TagK domain-containing protein n=1 Tax=Izhakiella australiensis TaxID=1926881 RepID=A0A1S8YMP1_9GAMM|nr:TagK domain-containing protein [Izhakiella australiensis]OON40178.1 hypothetical protein BTJ39_09790 [Izhakiella australiensis]
MFLSANIILLTINWPPDLPSFSVDGGNNKEGNALYFILSKAGASLNTPTPGEDFLCFYWTDTALMMKNHCHEHVCLINGHIQRPDNVITLQSGVMVQAGTFRLSVTMPDEDKPILSPDIIGDHKDLPELDEFLSHGGHYIPWDESAAHQDDVLKKLAYEYKYFLLWGRNSQEDYENEEKDENYLPERDEFLDSVTDSVKDKTITECIFDNEHLINRVIDEIMSINQPEEPEEQPPDLLTALAPDNMSRIEKHSMPELLYRELYKLGLDSHL